MILLTGVAGLIGMHLAGLAGLAAQQHGACHAQA
jgi:nucleoside-diphosphate-sugar epimerase